MLNRQNKIVEWLELTGGTVLFILLLIVQLIYFIFYGYFRDK